MPLLVAEGGSPQAAELLREDPVIVVSWATRTECVSAIRRRERDGALTAAEFRRSGQLLDELSRSWNEVLPIHGVRVLAERALGVHGLRAVDALQLAAAQVWSQGDPSGAAFVCLDERLRDAAAREMFSLLPLD